MRRFNTAVVCNPEKHYMVDISDRADRIIRDYIEPGNYFAINRGRQYGKTTTMNILAQKLREKYYCLQISFEGADEMFESDYSFVNGVKDLIEEQLELESVPEKLIESWKADVKKRPTIPDIRKTDYPIVSVSRSTDYFDDRRSRQSIE